jgi:hypothetical protein
MPAAGSGRSAIVLVVALSVGLIVGCSPTSSSTTATSLEDGAGSPQADPREEGGPDTDDAEDPAGSADLLPGPDDAGYLSLVRTVGADHGMAVAAVTGEEGAGTSAISVETLGPLETGVAWSTIKVPMAMAVIDAGAGAEFGDDIRLALTASDNDAAMRLWARLGGGAPASEAVTEQLRASGDQRTLVESQQVYPPYSPYGQTQWALVDQARFALGLRCMDAGREVAETMGDVVAEQRWGLGSTGTDVSFKGGWGPGSEPGTAGGYLVRQLGVVTVDGRELGVAIASRPGDGTFDSGVLALSAIAAWLADNVAMDAIATDSACGAVDGADP